MKNAPKQNFNKNVIFYNVIIFSLCCLICSRFSRLVIFLSCSIRHIYSALTVSVNDAQSKKNIVFTTKNKNKQKFPPLKIELKNYRNIYYRDKKKSFIRRV